MKHKNFYWYLSCPGDSCDKTCQINKLGNGATNAAKSIDEGDCTVMNNFSEQGKTELTSKSNTSYWTFGYFYESYSKYVCTSYGSYVSAGVGPGQKNLDSDRRVVCPCQRGILIQNGTISSSLKLKFYLQFLKWLTISWN